ncbi:MAG: hypothetical protein RLZZ227_1140 [Pseudomonadota bacterium]|jgi:tetratricopeptide (TPR) repeat protein
MSLHYKDMRRGLAAILCGPLLSIICQPTASAGQDLQFLSFHPVPLHASGTGSENPTADSEAAIQQMRPRDAAAREAEYREAIVALRSTEGPFALPVSERALELGRLLQQQGRFDEALAAYENSLHVLRVNLGLYSLEQAAVLRAIITAHVAKRDIANAHAAQEALVNLQLRHHGRSNPAVVPALLEWADWNVNLYLALDPAPDLQMGLHPPGRFHDPRLELAYDTYTLALQSLQQHAPAGDEQLVTTERKLAALNFITNQKMQDVYGEALMHYSSIEHDDAGTALESASATLFYEGSSALRRAIAHSERRKERRNDDIAARMVELGDWYLLFDHRAAALEQYRDALQFMRDASLPQDAVERIMSSGMPVPTPDTAYRSAALAEGQHYDGFIDVEFELSKFGMATNPHIIGRSAQNRHIERELMHEIRSCKFRPKFVADSAVNSEKMQLRYFYSF